MCQNSDYKIIIFLEPGAPHCLGNVAIGYDSCWSAAFELIKMRFDLISAPDLQERKWLANTRRRKKRFAVVRTPCGV